jgi:hypothetical protein
MLYNIQYSLLYMSDSYCPQRGDTEIRRNQVSLFTSLSDQKVTQDNAGRLGEPVTLQPVPMATNPNVRVLKELEVMYNSSACRKASSKLLLYPLPRPSLYTGLHHGATQSRAI